MYIRLGFSAACWLVSMIMLIMVASQSLSVMHFSFTSFGEVIVAMAYVSVFFAIPIVLAFSNRIVLRVVSGVYQLFGFFTFFVVTLTVMAFSNGLLLSGWAIFGTVLCLTSAMITISVSEQKRRRYQLQFN
ncbi:hypothetical protein [Geomicrobium sediminis]|uniref:ABC-type multidrug transport system permease subunit n=1 Tax=Geomicrobium sediminis TaxID=1347788 RepID=A0ABS2PHT8_9BACL|nr:hypothetical protein [Geomicrobium sediminis]MBM7634901.1 ABC-type multidrug transport system permease subunit [Geomicrobium sediminis]